ncbi:MAG: tetratricopeptide repeat protein [Candidatus Aerophobetes bacterium]
MNNKKITLDDLRKKIEEYKNYVVNIDSINENIRKMLTLRDEIEDCLSYLEKKGTPLAAEKVRLESFDIIIRNRMKMAYRKLAASFDLLSYRGKRAIPRSRWWWYLDELLKEKRSQMGKKWLIRAGVTAVGLLAAYVILTRVVPQPEPWLVHQMEADKLYEEGKLDEAIGIYEKAWILEPGNSTIPLMLGIIHEDKGLLRAANGYFERAKLLSSQEKDFYDLRGMIYFQKGKLDKAIVDVDKALEIGPDSAFSHFLLGNIYEAQNKIPEAMAEYEIVSRLDEKPELTVQARFKMGMMMLGPPSGPGQQKQQSFD